jgi:tripartite-type tricarboxylate transporter receptor subunit TctC
MIGRAARQVRAWGVACVNVLMCLGLLMVQPVSAQSQDYPVKPIKFVVSSPAGGVVDIRARRYGARLGELLKQPILVENRPGASTTIGAEYVAKSAPDGYTALFGGNTELVVLPALGMPLRYDAVRDFIPVAQFSHGHPLLVVHSGLGVRTLPQLIEWAKANPGKLMCGTSGHGSGPHFKCELLARTAGIQIRPVHYKGTGPMLLDTATGQVQLTIGFLAEVDKQYIQTGKVVPIGALAPRRIPRFPDVPTMTEQGFPGFEVVSWTGLFMPAGTPRAIVDKLNAAVTKIIREPDFVAWLAETGSEVPTPTADQFRDFVRGELAGWRKSSEELGIRLE